MNGIERTSIIHRVKILPEFYELVAAGIKTGELRKYDRAYCPGDVLEINEWTDGKYTGRRLDLLITHVLADPDYVKEGFCLLSFQIVYPDFEPKMRVCTWGRLYQLYLKVCRKYDLLKEQIKEKGEAAGT